MRLLAAAEQAGDADVRKPIVALGQRRKRSVEPVALRFLCMVSYGGDGGVLDKVRGAPCVAKRGAGVWTCGRVEDKKVRVGAGMESGPTELWPRAGCSRY